MDRLQDRQKDRWTKEQKNRDCQKDRWTIVLADKKKDKQKDIRTN